MISTDELEQTVLSARTTRSAGARGSGGRVEWQQEDRRLLLRYHRHGDLAAREEVVMRNMALARSLAGRYASGGANEDLQQVAAYALIKAVDRFDPERGPDLARFAVPTILGELKRHLRDTNWPLRVPRALQERALALRDALPRATHRLGRSPSVGELAEETGLSSEEVLEAQQAFLAYEPSSLDARFDAADDESSPRGELLGAEDEGLGLVELRAGLGPALDTLAERERRICFLRFELELTQSEIASELGISQMHVSRLLRRSLTTLREAA
jgi:RNA polymerase sigma-B factor